jgi:hypothetical protein
MIIDVLSIIIALLMGAAAQASPTPGIPTAGQVDHTCTVTWKPDPTGVWTVMVSIQDQQ